MDKHVKDGHSCIYEKRCDFVNLFKTESKQFWIRVYCNGEKQLRCKRRSYTANNRKIPERLLPNGCFIE